MHKKIYDQESPLRNLRHLFLAIATLAPLAAAFTDFAQFAIPAFALLALLYVALDRFFFRAGAITEPGLTETLIVSLIFGVISLINGWATQSPVDLNGGLGFDGINYAAMYELFLNGKTNLSLVAPYHQRIGQPFLASILPFPARTAFLGMHAFFWIGTLFFFVLTCRKARANAHHLTLLAVIWLNVHWISIPRGAVSYSFIVDSSLLFFASALSYLLLNKNLDWRFLLVAAVGTVFKETILLWIVCLAFAFVATGLFRTQTRRKDAIYLLLALAISVSINLACRNVFPTPPGMGTLETLFNWSANRLLDSSSLLRYAASALNALGPFLLVLAGLKLTTGTMEKPTEETIWQYWSLCLYLAVCFFSGSDLTKFVFLSFPFSLPVFLALTRATDQKRFFTCVFLLVVLCLPFTHFGEEIPSPFQGREIPNNDYFGPYSWMMEYAHLSWVAATLGWGAILLTLTTSFFRKTAADSELANR